MYVTLRTIWAHKGMGGQSETGRHKRKLELSMTDLTPYFGETNLESNVAIRWIVYVALYICMPDNYIGSYFLICVVTLR